MEDMTDSEASLAWVWVIEAMASFKEASLSLLHDLVQAAPELPYELACNAKEKIALRCLEDLLARQAMIPANVPLPSKLKIGFDFSESCEYVLQRIVEETSEADLVAGGSELAKWDIEPFIRHKRAGIPESALEKLSNLIRDGVHPEADFLRAKFGFGVVNQDVGVCVNDKSHSSVAYRTNVASSHANTSRDKVIPDPSFVDNSDRQVEGNLENGDVPSEKSRSDLGDEDRAGERENCDAKCDVDVQNNNAKRVKLSSSSDIHVVEENLVPLVGNGPVEDSPERNVSVSARGIDGGGQEMGTIEESRVVVDGCNDCTVSKRSDDNNNEEIREKEFGSPHNRTSLPQETRENEPNPHLPADESKGVDENLNEPNGSPSFGTLLKNSNDEPKTRNDEDFEFQGPNYSSFDGPGQQGKGIVDGPKNSAKECCEAETSSDSSGYHNEKTVLVKRKKEFLNSQQADSIEPTLDEPSEQTLCMKCNKAGQALVCSGNSCRMVFHEKCIGPFVVFDDNGKFYCPFCAYSLSITEYLEAKKRSSLSQKELSAFIQKVSLEHGLKKYADSLNKKKHCAGESKNENFANANQLEERGQEEGNQVVNNVDKKRTITDNQQSDRSETHNDHNTKEVRLRTSPGGTGGEKKVVKENPPRRSKGKSETLHPLDKLSSKDASVDVVNQCRKDLGTSTEAVKERDSGAPVQIAREFDIDSEISNDSDGDETKISNYCLKPRKRRKETTFLTGIPQLRRKKLPWTAQEEQKLKEGVQEFSDEQSVQWKKILEFGNGIFLKGRTTVDLKDKWRNMCRASSRPKI